MTLGYHELAPVASKDVYTLTPAAFAAHLALARATRPDSAGVITFDDAHQSQFHCALPLLSATQTTAQFFVPTARVGHDRQTATWSQLQELARLGHRIGSHSHTHPLLTQCTPAALRQELELSKKLLEDRLGISIDAISLPGGRGSRRVLNACAEAGYLRVYTSSPYPRASRHAWNGKHLEIVGRLIVRRGVSQALLAGYLNGGRAVSCRLRVEHRIKESAKALAGDRLYQWLWSLTLRRATPESASVSGEL